MEPSTELTFDDSVRQEIIDYCMEHKICVKRIPVKLVDQPAQTLEESKTTDEDVHAPLSVLPSPYSKASFERLTALQLQMNLMVHNMMCKISRVRELLAELGSKDEFVGGLLRISELVENSEHRQKGYLGVLRMDYMFDEETKEPKIVEYNTIASSFGPLSYGINTLHRYLVEKYGIQIDSENLERKKNPKVLIPEALKQAYNLYFDCDINDTADPSKGIIVTVVSDEERNVFDINAVINNLREIYGIQNKFLTFNDINSK